jgi:hypothetical protein
MDEILKSLAAGGPGYCMAAYLLWSGRVEREAWLANSLKTATVLASIRALFAARYGVPDPGAEEEK